MTRLRRPIVRLYALIACAFLAAVGLVVADLVDRHHAPGSTTSSAGASTNGRTAPRIASAQSCPGPRCPYRSISISGRHTEGVLRFPEAVALSPSGDVYVADQYTSAVQRFSPSGRYLGSWGSYGAGPGEFGAVGGLAVDRRGDVYLVDATHDRVEEFSARGRFLRAWGHPGTGRGQFDFGGGNRGDPPGGGIAVGGGHVYVADTRNDRIERFGPDGSGGGTWRGPGHGTARLRNPRGMAFADGKLYVANDGKNRVDLLAADGTLLRSVGGFGHGPGQFANPFGVAVGAGGDVYVADDNNHRVEELTPELGFIREWIVEADAAAQSEPRHNSGFEEVAYPRAIAASPRGPVYVADAAVSSIDSYDRNGRKTGAWGRSARNDGQFILPFAVAPGDHGETLVVDTYRGHIDELNAHLRYVTQIAGGEAIVGHHYFVPVSAARAADGSLWVADLENHVVRHLTADGRFIAALGLPDSGARRLLDPFGVAVGGNDRIYVADTGEAKVKIFSESGRVLSTWSRAGSAPFKLPRAIAVGASGDVYVVDAGADRVDVLTPSGHLLHSWGAPGSAPGELNEPDGIAVDASGQVFVSDAGNDRIEEFGSTGRLLAVFGHRGPGPGQLAGPGGLYVSCDGSVIVADTYDDRVEVFHGVASPSECHS